MDLSGKFRFDLGDLSGKFRSDLGDLSGKFRFDLGDLPSEPFFHVGEIGFEDCKIVFRRKFFLGQARQGPRLYVGLPFRNPGGFQFFGVLERIEHIPSLVFILIHRPPFGNVSAVSSKMVGYGGKNGTKHAGEK
jgi:hypothetical protein